MTKVVATTDSKYIKPHTATAAGLSRSSRKPPPTIDSTFIPLPPPLRFVSRAL